jgi:hypothetical protein
MSDEDGPQLAKGMYEKLLKKDQLDLDDIPYALDDAVRALRDESVPAERWALYIHIGGLGSRPALRVRHGLSRVQRRYAV